MNIMILVPRVVNSYIAQFPEVTNNAYDYFNFDHRVVNERVERGDVNSAYKGPEEFSDMDYDSLVSYAKTLINPILKDYSKKTSNEDALHMAIRSFCNGMFDGKINANRFNVLLQAMTGEQKEAKKKEPKKEEIIKVKPHVLKELGLKIKGIPSKSQLRQRVQKGVPHLLKTDKGIVVKK